MLLTNMNSQWDLVREQIALQRNALSITIEGISQADEKILDLTRRIAQLQEELARVPPNSADTL